MCAQLQSENENPKKLGSTKQTWPLYNTVLKCLKQSEI